MTWVDDCLLHFDMLTHKRLMQAAILLNISITGFMCERKERRGGVGVSCAVFVCVCILTWQQQQQQQLEALTSFARSNLEVIFSFVMRRKKREKEREKFIILHLLLLHFPRPISLCSKDTKAKKDKGSFRCCQRQKNTQGLLFKNLPLIRDS